MVRIFTQTSAMHAVITGDIVNSTKLDAESDARLLRTLEEILAPFRFEFFRGDSFQALLPASDAALQVALMCRTAAIGIHPEASTVVSDVRVAIGIGTIEDPLRNLGSAKGEAFLLSGRALDNLQKTEGRLVIAMNADPIVTLALDTMTAYVNSIYRQMTAKQAEVILELLRGETQQQVADKLNRSKSTISQHVTAGRWDEIEEILKNFTRITQLI